MKPDPPVELRVSQGGPHRLAVEWSPPPTWSNLEVFPLKYRVRYQRTQRSRRSQLSQRPVNHTVDVRATCVCVCVCVRLCVCERVCVCACLR